MILVSSLIKIGITLFIIFSATCSFYYFKNQHTQNEPQSEYFREQITNDIQFSPESKHNLGVWQQLQIRADYSNLEPYVNSAQLTFIKENLLNPSFAFLSTVLKVHPRTANVFVSTKCGNYAVSTSLTSGKLYDLGIIVAAVNDQTGSWWMRGVSCELDGTTNRPILGTFQINMAIFKQLNIVKNQNEAWEFWFQQAQHELIHLIGFNSVLYPYYINPDTNQVLGRDNVVKTFKQRQYIILKPVLDRVKTYFSCNAAVGALLEENGGNDIQGFHWERITFGNEIMTGDPFPDQVVSEFTLALLEGTGWYQPNYLFAQNFGWGKDDGCSLTTGQCSVVYEEFCKLKDQSGCSNNFNSLSGCYTGDQLSQGCYYWREQNDCRFHTDFVDQLAAGTGGTAGINSQCFITSLAQNIKAGARSSCYQAQCTTGKVVINVSGVSYYCSQDYQVISVKVGNQNGSVTCPELKKFCQQFQTCPNNCSNRGICTTNNQCKCWNGYQGNDCSYRNPLP